MVASNVSVPAASQAQYDMEADTGNERMYTLMQRFPHYQGWLWHIMVLPPP